MKAYDTAYQTGYRDGFIEGKSAGLHQAAYTLSQLGLPADAINDLSDIWDAGEPVVAPKLRYQIFVGTQLMAAVATEDQAHDWGKCHFGSDYSVKPLGTEDEKPAADKPTEGQSERASGMGLIYANAA